MAVAIGVLALAATGETGKEPEKPLEGAELEEVKEKWKRDLGKSRRQRDRRERFSGHGLVRRKDLRKRDELPANAPMVPL